MSCMFFIFIYFFVIQGWPLSQEALDEAAELSGVLEEDDYLDPKVRKKCERIIPELSDVKSRNAAETYLFLKAHYKE